jgi:hypothetical protein
VLIPNTLVVSEESYQQDGPDQSTGVQLSGRHAARDDTDRFAPVTEDTAGARTASTNGTNGAVAAAEAAVTKAAAEVAAADTAGERWPASGERWPADSGADPWTAHSTAQSTGQSTGSSTGYTTGEDWTTADPVTSWDGNGVGAAADSSPGLNGLAGFGDDVGWPSATDPVHTDFPAYPDPDQGGGDFADADSLPRRVRQASLAPQLRENTIHGGPAANGDPATTPETGEERSPEEARSTITAIQQGWERGRSLFDPPEKSTDTMTDPQSPAEPSPPEPGEAGPHRDE